MVFFLALEVSGIIYGIKRYRMWRETYLIITTRRVIDVDQVGLFRRHVGEVLVEEIESVNVLPGSGLSRLFQIGSLIIKVHSKRQADIEFSGIFQPERVRDLILDVQCLQVKTTHEQSKST